MESTKKEQQITIMKQNEKITIIPIPEIIIFETKAQI